MAADPEPTGTPMSVINSVRSVLVPIHEAGHPFIIVFAAVSVALAFVWQPLFWIGLALTIWCVMFFRDPPRVTPQEDGLVVTPADGRVSSIGMFPPPPELGFGSAPVQRISVFMNVFDVHVNRAPVHGRIAKVRHVPGKFLAADLDKASMENERNTVIFDTRHGEIACVQIAGLVARRILCWGRENDSLRAGERFGLIRFGSRCDLYLPDGADVRVSLGQKAIAGETVLAAFHGAVPGGSVRRA